MKLKSKELIEYFGTDEISEESEDFTKVFKRYRIRIDLQDNSKEEIGTLFEELKAVQDEFDYTFELEIRNIKKGEDVAPMLNALNPKRIDSLNLWGNLTGADFSRIPKFENMLFLGVINTATNFGIGTKEITLPPKCQGLFLINTGKYIKIDKSRLNEETKKRFILNNILKIDNVSELDFEELEALKREGYLEPTAVQVGKSFEYSIEEYKTILNKLNELIEGIDKNLPEEKRVMAIYERISKNIEYDFQAARPQNEEEEKYSEKEKRNCRNLKNGLIYGKCVCMGYADIMKNACNILGLEAKMGTGMAKDEKDIGHAWVKVKVDGNWYNFDPTQEHDNFVKGKPPRFAFEMDKDKEKFYIDIDGPACTTLHKSREKNVNITPLTIIKNFNKSMISIARRFLTRIGKTDEKLFLPEKTETEEKVYGDNKEEPKSWELSNWGIDKKEFIEEAKRRTKQNTKENEKKEETKQEIR